MIDTRPDVFWDWFLRNRLRLEGAIADTKSGDFDVILLADGIREALFLAGFDLAHEIGRNENGKFHLIISADGKREKVRQVLDLVQAAPKIEHWDVTAFRPRMPLSTAFAISPSETISIGATNFFVEETVEHTAVVLFFDDPLVAKMTAQELNFVARRCVEAMLGEYRTLNDIDYVFGSPTLPEIDRAILRPILELEIALREIDGKLPS